MLICCELSTRFVDDVTPFLRGQLSCCDVMILYEVVNSFVEWCGYYYFHINILGMVINRLFLS